MNGMKMLTTLSLALLLAGSGAAATTVQRELDAGPGGRLTFDLETGGNIEVTGWSESRVSVTADLDDLSPEEVGLTIDQSGRGILIRTKSWRHGRRTYDLEFRVKVPMEFDVDIDSSGGGVTLSDLEGTFEGETAGGALMLSQLRGHLALTTMGGEIRLYDSRVDGKVKTMGGNIDLREASGSLEVSTMGGNLLLEGISGGIHAETMGGSVTYGRGASGGGSGVVNLSTMGGDITLDEAPEGADVETMGGDIEIGMAGVFVKATTMGGDIQIDEADGSVKASTMGGDVRVRVVEGGLGSSHDVEISSEGGDITLTVPPDFSMDIDVEIGWTRSYDRRPRVNSDFPLDVNTSDARWRDESRHRGWERRIEAKGSHAGGRNRVVIRTVNGDVHIRKG